MRVLSMILAGGKGRRLYPLTRHRTKPAVPFGGNYRIIDFSLSNLINSGLNAIYVLVQYRSQSLIEHLRTGWRGHGLTTDQFITVVPPQMRHGQSWYRGNADAVAQNLNLVQTFAPEVLAVFAGDLVFRMDVGAMIEFHSTRRAEITVASSPVALDEARGRLGVIRVSSDWRIEEFVEKPDQVEPMPGRPGCVLASMGCYLFDPQSLVEILGSKMNASDKPLDISRDLLPRYVERGRAYAYNFETNEVPGIKPYERRGYWCDVGTIASYWSAHMDLLGPEPVFDLRNPAWPIHAARTDLPPTIFVSAKIEDSLIGEGCRIEHAAVRRSVIGRDVTIGRGAVVEESVIMNHTRIGAGARVCRAIVDRFNEIADRAVVAPDAPEVGERFFVDRHARLVVVPRGGIAPPAEEIGPDDESGNSRW